MKSTLTILFFLLISLQVSTQVLTVPEVVEKSKRFYSSIQGGLIEMEFHFKSSIAESQSKWSQRMFFWRPEKTIAIYDSVIGFLYSPKKLFLINFQKKQYVDYSKNTDLTSQKKNEFLEYPHLNPNYFDKLLSSTFKVEKNEFYHIFNFSEHYYFDTINFSLTKYRNVLYSLNGLQIKQWIILNQNYHNKKSTIFNGEFPDKFTRVRSFTIENPELSGKNIFELVQSPQFVINKNFQISLDTLKNKYLYVDFFYQSCMPCIQMFPHIKKLQKYVDQGKLFILGIDPILADSTTMDKFKHRYQIIHPILTGLQATTLTHNFNPSGVFPFALIVNPGGTIYKVFEGFGEKFIKEVEYYLADKFKD